MKVQIAKRIPAPGAWRAMRAFERKVVLANFRQDHIDNENRRQIKTNLHRIEGALTGTMTPEYAIHAHRERVKLRSLLD